MIVRQCPDGGKEGATAILWINNLFSNRFELKGEFCPKQSHFYTSWASVMHILSTQREVFQLGGGGSHARILEGHLKVTIQTACIQCLIVTISNSKSLIIQIKSSLLNPKTNILNPFYFFSICYPSKSILCWFFFLGNPQKCPFPAP